MDPTQHPWLIYTTLILAIIVAIATAFPKILGPIGQGISDWTARQRTAAMEADDADIRDLRRERDYLQGVADERAAELARRDALIRAHAPWDWAMFEDAVKRGERPEDPPPLIPHVPPPVDPDHPASTDRPQTTT